MNLLLLPLLLPLFTALLGLFWNRPSAWRRRAFTLSAVAQLAAAVGLVHATHHGSILVNRPGGWAAPFGIALVVDLLSALMLAFSALTVLGTLVYGFLEKNRRTVHPLRLPLIQFLVLGVNLALMTGDLFNLFVAFEIMLIASYALMTQEADNWDIKQAFPYVAINLIGSTLFLSATGLCYGLFGTLNFAELARRIPELGTDPRVGAVALMLLVVFGIKAGLFPLFYWLPNSYPTLPVSLSALFGGLLTKVGVYVLIRIFGTVFPPTLQWLYELLGVLALLTAILGGLGAISRGSIRGILSFHILSQIGLMLVAVSLMHPLALAGALFILLHNILVKSSLFLIGGTAARVCRSDNLDRMGNLWQATPWLGLLFLLQALSLAGVPPLSGFWGKYLLISAGLQNQAWVLVGGAMIAGVLTLFSMLKIWNAAFWTHAESRSLRLSDRRWPRMTGVAAIFVALSLLMGIAAEPFVHLTRKAAEGVLAREAYIAAVLQPEGKGLGLKSHPRSDERAAGSADSKALKALTTKNGGLL